MKKTMKEHFLRFFFETKRKLRTILEDIREKLLFERTKLKKTTRKRRNQKGEEKLKGFHRKRWEKEMKKRRLQHEAFATIKGRDNVFFGKKRCLATKKESNNEECDREGHQEDTYKGEETWKEWKDIEKETRNWKNVEKQREWDKRNEIFCGKWSKEKEKCQKRNKHEQNIFLRKRWNGYKKGKVWKKDERKIWWKKNKKSKEIQFLEDGRVSERKK